MKITKFKNGKINLKLRLRNGEGETLESILEDDELHMNDLYFRVDASGVMWLIDYETKLVYDPVGVLDTSKWRDISFFNKLISGKTIKLIPYGNIDEAREYFQHSEFEL